MQSIAKTAGKAFVATVAVVAAVVGIGLVLVHQSPQVERRGRYV